MTMPVGTEGSYWGSPELQDSIGEAVAEAEGSVETPTESPSGDEGAVESAHDSPSSSPRAEGTADDAGNDDQQSRGTPPDGEAEEGPEVQFEPFAYTVNGESRTLDGFHLVPGEGVYIPTDQVPRLQQIASRAEASEAALRELHQQTQATERASQWTVYGDDGRPSQTLSGVAAIQQMRVDHAKMAAALEILSAPYRDTQALLGLLTQDAEGNITVNPREIQNLVTAGQLAQLRAEQRVRQSVGANGTAVPSSSPQAPTPQPGLTLTPEQSIPAVQHLTQQWGMTGLTQDDLSILAQALPRYMRAATPEDVAQDPLLRVGQPVVENSFQALVAHQAAMRAQQSTAGKAGKFNAGQAQGRAGQRPAARPKSPSAPESVPTNGKRKPKADWDAILSRGMQDPDVQAALSGER